MTAWYPGGALHVNVTGSPSLTCRRSATSVQLSPGLPQNSLQIRPPPTAPTGISPSLQSGSGLVLRSFTITGIEPIPAPPSEQIATCPHAVPPAPERPEPAPDCEAVAPDCVDPV